MYFGRLKHDNNEAFKLSLAEQKLKNEGKSKQTLASVLSKRKLITIDKHILKGTKVTSKT